MSLDVIRHLSRAQLLEVAAELSDDSLRAAVRSVLAVAPLAQPPGGAGAAPVATIAAPAAPAAKKAKATAAAPATPPAAPAAATSGDPAIDTAIHELGKLGFAMADLAAALSMADGPTPKLKRAVDKAVAAGALVKVGEKRFTRYGATKEIADAAKARG